MIRIVKKYWPEISIFGLIALIMLIDLSPGITWVNTDSDGAHYILAAKYFTTAHNLSAPLYLIWSHFMLLLPFGSEAWRMGLTSALSTIIASILVYLIIRAILKDNPKSRISGLFGALVYGGSALVISQSTIIETYALSTMLGLAAYYFSLKKRWIATSIMLGLCVPVHILLALFVWAVLFFQNKSMRAWKPFIITSSFALFYLYLPIVGKYGTTPTMWNNTSLTSVFSGTMGVVTMLTGGISIWDLPKRILDTIGILGVSLGIAIIPLTYHFIKVKKWRYHLLWLFVIPIFYFVIDLAAETYVYMIVAVAYGSIAAGIGISYFKKQYILAMFVTALLLTGFNANYFDIGRTLDKDMSAMMFYKELDKIPDGQIFLGGGWNWAMVGLYNKEQNRKIIPVSTDMLSSKKYRDILDSENIKYTLPNTKSLITLEGEMSVSIAELNNGVWIAKETKPEVYQYVVEPAKDNKTYLTRWIGEDIQPTWRFKPSNPYLYITGALEVKEWNHILWSNKNANMFIGIGVIIYCLYTLALRQYDKRRINENTFIQKEKRA